MQVHKIQSQSSKPKSTIAIAMLTRLPVRTVNLDVKQFKLANTHMREMYIHLALNRPEINN